MDDLETHYISVYSTIHPFGYNLAPGGRKKHSVTTTDFERATVDYIPISKSSSKTESTKTKMIVSRQRFIDQNQEYMDAKYRELKNARLHKKLQQFEGTVVKEPLDQYVTVKRSSNGWVSTVLVGETSTTFVSKFDTRDECKQRAIEFLKQIYMNQTTIATSSN